MSIRKDIKIYEYFRIIFFIAIILINALTFYSCVGININILYMSIVVTFCIVVLTMFGTRITNKIVNHLIILLFAVVVSYSTYISTPQFSYKEAQTVLIKELSKEYNDVKLLETTNKSVKLTEIDQFINRIYSMEVNYEENNYLYHFNPFTSEYILVYKIE